MDKTCCPLYTIRCESLAFELSRSQKKVLRTMKKFLDKDERKKERKEENKSASTGKASKSDQKSSSPNAVKEIAKSSESKAKVHSTNATTHAKRVMDYFLSETCKILN